MKVPKKWMRTLSIALSLPGSILGTFFLSFQLSDNGIISKNTAILIALGVVIALIFLMVYYAVSKGKD